MTEHSADRHSNHELKETSADWFWSLGKSRDGRRGAFCRPDKDFTQIPNGILKAIYSRGFSDWEKRILLAICRWTYGWEDRRGGISSKWISEETGIWKRHVKATVKNLLVAHVLTFRTPRRRGKALDLWIQEDTSLWDLHKLKRLRGGAQGEKERGILGQIRPGTESVTRVGTESVTGSEHGIRAPLNILNISLNKPGAAEAAVSSSQSREGKGEGLLGDERQAQIEPSDPEIGAHTVSKEQCSYIDDLRAKLKKVGHDPDPWLVKAVRDGAVMEVITYVLEEGLRQKGLILGDFFPWAKKVCRVRSDALAIEAAEREQQHLKREDMQSAGEILKQVLQEGQQEKADGEVVN